MRMTTKCTVATIIGVCLSGCGSGQALEIASVHVKSELISAARGGSIGVTSAEHARLAGTRIEIPAAALARDTTITIDPAAANLVDADTDVAGPTVEFGPDGTQFAQPVRITLPYEGAADEDLFRVFVTESNGTTRVLLPRS